MAVLIFVSFPAVLLLVAFTVDEQHGNDHTLSISLLKHFRHFVVVFSQNCIKSAQHISLGEPENKHAPCLNLTNESEFQPVY